MNKVRIQKDFGGQAQENISIRVSQEMKKKIDRARNREQKSYNLFITDIIESYLKSKGDL